MGIQSFNPSPEKRITIDLENEFDSSATSRRVSELEAKIKKTEEEILEYEDRRNNTSERNEEKREMLDNILDQKRIFLVRSRKELEALRADKMETDFERDKHLSEIFGGKENKPEILE